MSEKPPTLAQRVKIMLWAIGKVTPGLARDAFDRAMVLIEEDEEAE